MDSISSPQDDYFILIHMHYLAFVHFVTQKHFASMISFIIYWLSYLFANDKTLTELCTFSKKYMSHETECQISLLRLPSRSQNTDFFCVVDLRESHDIDGCLLIFPVTRSTPGVPPWLASMALKLAHSLSRKNIKV